PARAKSTVNAYLSAVYAFYQFHQRHGVDVISSIVTTDGRPTAYKRFLSGIASGPSTRRLVTQRVPKRRVKTLTSAQVFAIIEAQKHLRDEFLFTLLYMTGMRIGQALGLRHEDIDVEARTLTIFSREDNLNQARAKGEPGTLLGQVPVSEQFIEMYTRYLHEEYGDIDSDYVFINLWGGTMGAPMTYTTVNDLVRRTRKRVGFDFTVHQFRHTFATQCREAKMDVQVLSKLLTHKSVATTIDIYSHLSPEFMRSELREAGMIDGDL
ncbi:MAG: tyrosine-type recombinase/integrase, partial [Nocardioidaceae bacterium]